MNGKIEKTGKVISSIMKSVEADHLQGIRIRTRIATICSLCFMVIYVLFISVNYSSVPSFVPEFRDVNGVLVDAVHKSAFILYGFEFLLLFLLTVLVSWIMKPFFKDEIIYARTRCLFLDIVNLYVTTAICITMVLFAIARGDESENLSYFSQLMILLFWVIVMAVEYVFDVRKIRRSS